MSGEVKVVRLYPGWFKDKVVIEAITPCSRVFNSFLGARDFYMNKGTRITTKVKKDRLDLGETYLFNSVINSDNAWDFSWDWGYG